METVEQTQAAITPQVIRKKALFTRCCDECGKEYQAAQKNSKFCSDICRVRNHKKNPKTADSAGQVVPVEKAKDVSIPSPIITGVSPQLQIAIGLLQENAKRWETEFREERDLRKKVEAERDKLKEQLVETENKHRLEGIENEKPSVFERVLGSLPEPIVNHLAPVLGEIAKKLLIPGGGEAQAIAGVEGQLDQAQLEFLQWIAQLPEQAQQKVVILCTSMMQMQPQQLSVVLDKIFNLLKTGSTINHTQSHNPMMNGTY